MPKLSGKGPPLLAAAAVAVFLVVGVVAYAGADRDPQQVPSINEQPNGSGPDTERLFAIFRSERNASNDALPPPPAGARTGAFGIDRAQSRKLDTDSTRSRAWALPAANDFSCIAYLPPDAEGPGFSCNPSSGGPNIVYRGVAGKYEVFGLVRDGYDSAVVSFADGSEQRADIRRNSFALRADTAPRAVSLSGELPPARLDLGQ